MNSWLVWAVVLPFHIVRSSVAASVSEQPHQSMMSLVHRRTGLPHGRLPSTIHSITVFTGRWSFILLMRPNIFTFIVYSVLSLYSVSDAFVADFVFPVHFQYQIISNFTSYLFAKQKQICDYRVTEHGRYRKATKNTRIRQYSIFR